MQEYRDRLNQKKRLNSTSGHGEWGRYLNSGITMAAALLFWILLGVWAEKNFGYSPWFVLSGTVLGLISVFYELYKLIKFAAREENDFGDSQ